MLTIFSTPKPFSGHIKIIQTNAIRSWVTLRPACEVILFGDEEGTAELAAELGIRHIPEVERNEYGTPLVSSLFHLAETLSSHQLLCYVNADIILMSDFLSAVGRVSQRPFLLVGQRWDIDLREPVDFLNPNWESELRAALKERGRLHGITGIDYFAFPKGVYPDIPPFAIGRPAWDNWMIYHSRARKIPVIDATPVVTVVHQNHGHGVDSEEEKRFWEGPEAKQNLKLAGGVEHAFHLGYADWILTGRGLQRALSLRRLYFRFRAVPVLYPQFHFLMPLITLPGKLLRAIGFPKGK